MWFQWKKFRIKILCSSKMKIVILMTMMLFLLMRITPITASSRNLGVRSEMTVKGPLSMKNLPRRELNSHTVKAIIKQSQICDIFASKMISQSSLAIIKIRYPLFFTECQLKLPSITKIQSMTNRCKRFGWKGRSLHC